MSYEIMFKILFGTNIFYHIKTSKVGDRFFYKQAKFLYQLTQLRLNLGETKNLHNAFFVN